MNILNAIVDILMILATILLGALVIAFVLDLLLSIFSRKKGLFTRKKAKDDYDDPKTQKNEKKIGGTEKNIKKEDVVYYKDVKKSDKSSKNGQQAEDDEFDEVDFTKAVEEQQAILREQEKKMRDQSGKKPAGLSPIVVNNNEEENFDEILDNVTKEAWKVYSATNAIKEIKPVKKLDEGPVFSPITAPPAQVEKKVASEEAAELKRLKDEIAKEREEIATLKKELLNPKTPDKTEVMQEVDNKTESELARVVAQQLDDFKKEILEKEKEIQRLKQDKVSAEEAAKLKREEDEKLKRMEELNKAKELYNKEREELERIKKEWQDSVKKEEEEKRAKEKMSMSSKYDGTVDSIVKDLTESKRAIRERDEEIKRLAKEHEKEKQEVGAISKDLSQSKRELREKEEEINRLINFTKENEKEKQELEKLRQQWQVREQELLEIQRKQKEEANRNLEEIKRDLEFSKRDIKDKEYEMERLRRQKEDFSKERDELDEMRRKWLFREQELLEIQRNQKHENQKEMDTLTRDLQVSQQEIAAKQSEIDNLIKIQANYTEANDELERMKQTWRDKELALIQLQQQQQNENKKQVETINKELQNALHLIENKESHIKNLQKQKEDYSIEIEELERLKTEWSLKEKELIEVQKTMREDDKRAVDAMAKQLEDSKARIADMQSKNEKMSEQITAKQNQIESLKKQNEDYSMELKELDKLKVEWKEREESLIDYQEKQEYDRRVLLEKMSAELKCNKEEIANKEREISELKKLKEDSSSQQKELNDLKDNLTEREQELHKIQVSQNVSKAELKAANKAVLDNSKYITVARMNATLAKIMSDTSKIEKESTENKVLKKLQIVEDKKKREVERARQLFQQQLMSSQQKFEEAKIKMQAMLNSGNIQSRLSNIVMKTSSPKKTKASIQYTTTRNEVVKTASVNNKQTEKSKPQIVYENKALKKPAVVATQRNLTPAEKRLQKLEEEYRLSQKELKNVADQYFPILKIKETMDNDLLKLNKKEASVAKQKLALYGGKNASDVPSAKKEKIDKDMQMIKNLKERINTSTKYLQQNENRLPDLEKNYKLIQKNLVKMKDEMDVIKSSMPWFVSKK